MTIILKYCTDMWWLFDMDYMYMHVHYHNLTCFTSLYDVDVYSSVFTASYGCLFADGELLMTVPMHSCLMHAEQWSCQHNHQQELFKSGRWYCSARAYLNSVGEIYTNGRVTLAWQSTRWTPELLSSVVGLHSSRSKKGVPNGVMHSGRQYFGADCSHFMLK